MAHTDDLITLLSKDNQQSHGLRKQTLMTLLWLVPATLLMVYWVINLTDMPPRKDYWSAIQLPMVLAKQLIPLLMVITLIPLAKALHRPDALLGKKIWFTLAAASLVDIVIFVELLQQPMDSWGSLIIGKTLQQCLTGISLIAATILVGGMAIMRGGASVRPAYTGFITGIISGGIAAFLYAFLCMEDSPLFYGVWYSLAILNMGLIGALIGNKALRW